MCLRAENQVSGSKLSKCRARANRQADATERITIYYAAFANGVTKYVSRE